MSSQLPQYLWQISPASPDWIIIELQHRSAPPTDHSYLIGVYLQIALRLDIKPNKVKNVIIWGNHSSTQFPDVSHATVCRDNDSQQVYAAVNDDAWLKGEFIKVNCCIMDHVILLLCDTLRTVQGRGAAVIKARKLLSAKSAAKAIVDHMRDWWNGTPQVIIIVSLCILLGCSYHCITVG